MSEKIERMIYLSHLRKFTEVEFREFDGYMKEINPNWNGCKVCPAQIAFGQKILLQKVSEIQSQLPSAIESSDEIIDVEPKIEAPIIVEDFPVGEVKVTSKCSRCKKKNKG
jgi:hypothetical protein